MLGGNSAMHKHSIISPYCISYGAVSMATASSQSASRAPRRVLAGVLTFCWTAAP